jgi:hypothetical protein
MSSRFTPTAPTTGPAPRVSNTRKTPKGGQRGGIRGVQSPRLPHRRAR